MPRAVGIAGRCYKPRRKEGQERPLSKVLPSIVTLRDPAGNKKAGTVPVTRLSAGKAFAEPAKVEINHGGGEQSQHLADYEAPYDSNSKRLTQFRPGPPSERHGHTGKQRAHR